MTSLALSQPGRDRSRMVGILLVAGAALCWSIAGIVVRQIETADAWAIIAWRSLSMMLCIGAYLALRYRGHTAASIRAIGWAGLVGGVGLALAFTGFVLSLSHTSVANTLFVLAAGPFFGAMLGWLVLGEKVQAFTWAACALALAGIGIMVADGLQSGSVAGSLFALLATGGFAVYTIALRQGRAVDMTPVVLVAGAVSAGVGLAASATPLPDARDLLLCFMLGAVQISLGMLLYTVGSRRLPAAELILLALLEIVFGTLWVALFLGEAPAPMILLGGGIVLAAVIGQALWGSRRTASLAAPTPPP